MRGTTPRETLCNFKELLLVSVVIFFTGRGMSFSCKLPYHASGNALCLELRRSAAVAKFVALTVELAGFLYRLAVPVIPMHHIL